MTREQLIDKVHLVLLEQGATLNYYRVKDSDIAVFEGDIPVGKIVDVILSSEEKT